jgi:hypothetical protein
VVAGRKIGIDEIARAEQHAARTQKKPLENLHLSSVQLNATGLPNGWQLR